MRELATQASNDTNNAQDRTNISGEMGQLKTEIDRIANTTAWAGVKLLDGNSTAQAINLQVGSNTSSYDKLTVKIDSVTAGKLGIAGSAAGAQTSGEVGSGGVSASGGNLSQASFAAGVLTLSGTLSAGNVSFIVTTATGSATTITVAVTTALEGTSGSARDAVAKLAADKLNEANIGYMGVASTDGTGKVTVTKGGVDVSSSTAAGATVATIDAALNTINTQRAKLGATSNRLDSTISNLTNISANLTAGKGRVEDADFAGESTNMARSQILQQAATAMLAQANASKQGVLQLLQR
jgi:flagellin